MSTLTVAEPLDSCWLCDGGGQIETHKVSDGQPATVGCPVCMEKDQERLKAELENRSHEPDMGASDAYHHCADLIEPHVVDTPHGTQCNDHSLCRSVCESLMYLIGHWKDTARRDACMKAEALERAIKVMSQPMTNGGQPWLIRVEDVQAMAAEYRKQAKGEK